MYKVLSNKLQVAKINDTSYYKNLLAVTINRKDGEQIMWKWVKENNANMNFNEVSALYNNIMVSIDNERLQLFSIEKELQTCKYNYEILHNQFPSKMYLYYQKTTLDYLPISSSESKIINKTGVDDNFKIK
jgi:hypothetical protein